MWFNDTIECHNFNFNTWIPIEMELGFKSLLNCFFLLGFNDTIGFHFNTWIPIEMELSYYWELYRRRHVSSFIDFTNTLNDFSTWNATASMAALQMWFLEVNWVRPIIIPRASERQYGAKSPLKLKWNYFVIKYWNHTKFHNQSKL